MINPQTLLTLSLTAALLPFFFYLSLITVAVLVRRPVKVQPVPASNAPLRFLFVIPAHDEERTIGFTIESCQAVDYPSDRFTVIVIADNCTDATARVARDAGAVVVERTDPIRRSKGHALEFFFDHTPEARPDGGYDAAVVIDADTTVDPWILNAFSTALAEGKDWIQCYDTVRNRDSSWRTRLMTYAFSLINGVWLVGQERLGLGASLKGNGMCLSLRGLARFPWRASGLAEDAEFSWMLRISGERISFLPEASVHAEMVVRGGPPAVGQRCRWEAGRRALRSRFLGPLLRSRKMSLYQKLMNLTELFFPSLVFLTLTLVAATSVHVWAWLDPRLLPVSRLLLPVHGAMTLTLTCYVLSPIFIMGLPVRFFACLALLPYYAVWKLLITIRRSPKEWVRTQREPKPQPTGVGDILGHARANSNPGSCTDTDQSATEVARLAHLPVVSLHEPTVEQHHHHD